MSPLLKSEYYQNNIHANNMSLNKKDIEVLEKIMYKNSDDVAVVVARSFERLEERIDLLRNDFDTIVGVMDVKAPRFDFRT